MIIAPLCKEHNNWYNLLILGDLKEEMCKEVEPNPVVENFRTPVGSAGKPPLLGREADELNWI